MKTTSRSSATDARTRLRIIAPFGLAALLPVLLEPLPPEGGDTQLMIYAAITVVVVAVVVALPWHRGPTWALTAPGLVYCVALAFARDGEGGVTSGLGFLFMLPVMFQALYGSRVTVLVTILGAAVAFAAPIIAIGEPLYPTAEWRRVVVWSGMAPVIGIVVHNLVVKLRQHQEAITRVTTAAHSIGYEGDSREGICQAALDLARCDVAVLMEPRAESMVSTAGAGLDVPDLRVEMGREPSAVEIAYRSGEPFFVADVHTHPAVSRRLVGTTLLASSYLQPVVRGDQVVGVLVVGWRAPRVHVGRSLTEALGLLAAEAAVAMERADRFSTVASLAASDPLTGLPNRRRWDEEAGRMTARAGRSGEPLTVAILDLDRFKAYNDAHGHQAGDRVLKEAAAAWRDQLRAGDLLARWGGEEFAVALPGTTAEAAVPVLERLRHATPGGQTASAGVAQLASGDTLAAVVERADRALYAAKTAGRDRLELVDALTRGR